MTIETAGWVLIAWGVLLANLPWLMTRRWLFGLIPLAQCKSVWLSLAEWLLYWFLWLASGYLLELKMTGTVQPQEWEFWTTQLFLFMIFAFPGFIYRYNFQRFVGKNAGKT